RAGGDGAPWSRQPAPQRETQAMGLSSLSPPPPRRNGMRPRLALEPLEDRLVLSTLTVRNNADSGPGSLRATIAAAAAGDTIVFSNALNGQTIRLTSGQLTLTRDLDIEGPGAPRLTISGNDASRVFAVGARVRVMLA